MFYLKTEIEFSLRNVVFCNINRKVFLDKDRTMDNVQKHNTYSNVPSSQTFRSMINTVVTKIFAMIINHIKCHAVGHNAQFKLDFPSAKSRGTFLLKVRRANEETGGWISACRMDDWMAGPLSG
jgi:hypothetical protein